MPHGPHLRERPSTGARPAPADGAPAQIYDTVKDKGFTPNARSQHGIASVIDNVLEVYDEPAKCVPERDCEDCMDWKYV